MAFRVYQGWNPKLETGVFREVVFKVGTRGDLSCQRGESVLKSTHF